MHGVPENLSSVRRKNVRPTIRLRWQMVCTVYGCAVRKIEVAWRACRSSVDRKGGQGQVLKSDCTEAKRRNLRCSTPLSDARHLANFTAMGQVSNLMLSNHYAQPTRTPAMLLFERNRNSLTRTGKFIGGLCKSWHPVDNIGGRKVKQLKRAPYLWQVLINFYSSACMSCKSRVAGRAVSRW